ncbi:glutathione S-transferase family protein [Pararhodobacter sp.]|uniref:glutathione S-transferase family protein n=1 Tax=Pararhodobacter sp. TaxID=2127056 RepID=UPI002AFE717F|nr:glutathione S-transferase family protein [Pararhodobacter sp.]
MPLLHWSPRSPYVRKTMIALQEKGLSDQVRTVRTGADPMIPHPGLMAVNPLSKIPTLELEDGRVLIDSHVICRWADRTGGEGPRLFPEGEAGLLAERDEALGAGLMDIALNWLIEGRLRDAPQRSEAMLAVWQTKTVAVLDWLETLAPSLAARPFDIGHLTIGTALMYLDFRFAAEEWRKHRPALAEWHAGFLARPSVRREPFQDDPRPAS